MASNGIGKMSGRAMKIDVGIYNGSVDIGDFLRAIDFKVATEGKGYTEEEAAQARRVLLTTRGYLRRFTSTSTVCRSISKMTTRRSRRL